MEHLLEQLLPVLELRLGPIEIITAALTHPQHGTGTLDKKFRPCWLDLETNLGPKALFLKVPHHAEPGIYSLLEDLRLPAPRLWGTVSVQGEEICVLDDCGRTNLAQVPGNSINHCHHTPESVITSLGRLHAQGWGDACQCGTVGWRDAQFYLQRLNKVNFNGWEESPYKDSFSANLPALTEGINWLNANLEWVFAETWSLTHGDASAVNVAMDETGHGTLVDWGDSRVSTCLWDLPHLVNTPDKFRTWHHTLVSHNPSVPSHDELYAKYLGTALYAALGSCAGRLTAWRMQFDWMPKEYLTPEAVAGQFQQLQELLALKG